MLVDPIAERLILDGKAFPANGLRAVEPTPEGLPHIDERVEVHGLTDRVPEFFEQQGERLASEAIDRAYSGPPEDRMMHRGKNRKGR